MTADIILFLLLTCFFVYFGIRAQYVKDIPIHPLNLWNPLGPVEYTIKEVTEVNSNYENCIKYYKIYWNLYPALKKIGINLMETSDQIVYIGNGYENIQNYFKTVLSAINFINADRVGYNYTINKGNS